MKSYIFILLLCVTVLKSFSQSTSGITNKPDTAYTNHSAFINTKKSHPEIILAEGLRSKNVKEKRNIRYCRLDKRSLLLDAFIPSKKIKKYLPAIMIIHGGGWRSGNKFQHHALAQRLAHLGYVCFTPEYRLSTEALFPAAIYDLKAAVRWILANAKKYRIDTSKIAVLGFSAGGELAAFIGTTIGNPGYDGSVCNKNYSGKVQAVIDMDGTLSFVHPESGEGDDSKRTSAATYWFGYSKKENLKLWEEASPLTHAGAQSVPTLFINSAVDRMHAGRTDYISKLNKHNIYTEVKAFEGAPHSFPLFHPWFEPTIKYIDEFLKKVFLLK